MASISKEQTESRTFRIQHRHRMPWLEEASEFLHSFSLLQKGKLRPRERGCPAHLHTALSMKPLYKSQVLNTALLPPSLVRIAHMAMELVLNLM